MTFQQRLSMLPPIWWQTPEKCERTLCGTRTYIKLGNRGDRIANIVIQYQFQSSN